MTRQLPAATRRVKPVVPPLGAEAVPAEDRALALGALAELSDAAAYLEDPDLFHRPRARTRLHLARVRSADPRLLTGQVTAAAEQRVAAGLLAVRSVRAELAERPGERPCFTPAALAELNRLLVAADPDVPGRGGFRRTPATVTWPDGQRFVVAVAPGRALHGHVERWYRWGTRTTSPALDAAALQMVRLYTVHPFPDGNGRTARLLAQCDLVGAGLLPGLLLDLEGWADLNREALDRAVVAAAEGETLCWGKLFARAVTETARHRTATLAEYRRVLDGTAELVADDPDAVAVLGAFRSAPAVSADSVGGRTAPGSAAPAVARLRAAGILAPHPRLPGALVQPRLLAVLDAPYAEPGD
ncbi:Fic family protein [Kitasatospora sp. NPDC093550]|uniref:Fic family protein n=1 Tax=Kitasatospora sp. NPDC093550 TaxID=3364089 RepID=UPI003811EAEA